MKKRLAFFVIILFAVSVAFFWRETFTPGSAGAESKIFSVIKGEGIWHIATNLREQKLTKNTAGFYLSVFLQNGARRLQAGDYELNSGLTPWEIARYLINGETARRQITFPEGWGIREIGQAIEKETVLNLKKEDFFRAADFDPNNCAGKSKEGYLFPDTYEIKRGESGGEVVEKMLSNFNRKLTPAERQEIRRQGKSLAEVVTLASIVEKEAQTPGDKKIVAGILWKRIGSGMRLQADATRAYLSNCPRYDTYRFDGLPPGPIANPGLESLSAAIYPQESEYWYYLSAPDHTIYFSRTLAEHNLKRAKYLK